MKTKEKQGISKGKAQQLKHLIDKVLSKLFRQKETPRKEGYYARDWIRTSTP